MFPFRPNNPLQYPTPYNNPIIPNNLTLDDLIEGQGVFLPTTSNQEERLIPFEIQENEEKIKNNEAINARKFVRKEMERQRRQEMGNLCGSLRTLLPPEYVKGNRSMSDHLQGAVNYIKDMKNNIHQLKVRRDRLEKLSNSQIHGDNNLHNCVTVNPCPNGVEILINTMSEEEQGFCLSRILKELLDRGFNVVSCFSTKANERSLHTIQLEASNPTLEDVSGLQKRLTYMINYPRLEGLVNRRIA